MGKFVITTSPYCKKGVNIICTAHMALVLQILLYYSSVHCRYRDHSFSPLNTVNNKKKFIATCCFCFEGLKCGKNKFYWWSAPACPNMCTDPNAEKTCGLPKTESCRCKHGFVLSGDKCVRQNDCGCSRGPNYYPVFFNMS